MNIEQLEYIVEIAKLGSIMAVSQKVHVSQSAISQSIANLEAELGVKIFTRSRKGSVPTDIGKKVIKKAFEALDKLQELREEAQAGNALMEGELRIATIPGPMMFFPEILSVLKTRHKNMKILVFEKPSQDILNDFDEDKIDLALISPTQQMIDQHEKLHFEVVLRGKTVVAVSGQSPLAFAEYVTLQELREYPLVLYNDDRIWDLIRTIDANYGPLKILFSTNNLDAIRNTVIANLAVTLGPSYTVMNDPYVKNGMGVIKEIIEDDQEEEWRLALVWIKNARRNVVIKDFASILSGILRNHLVTGST